MPIQMKKDESLKKAKKAAFMREYKARKKWEVATWRDLIEWKAPTRRTGKYTFENVDRREEDEKNPIPSDDEDDVFVEGMVDKIIEKYIRYRSLHFF